MAINLPGELSWVLHMLDFEWPEVDEDELRKLAQIMRDFKDDVEATVQEVDTVMESDLKNALKAGAQQSYTDAWTENRQDNMNKMLELIDPMADVIEVAADVVVALKLKVIAELVITAAQIAAAIATAFVTFGASAAAQAAIIVARKQALKFATNVMIEQIIMQVMEAIIEPLTTVGAAIMNHILDSPETKNAVGDPREFTADLAALEDAAGALEKTAADQQRIGQDYMARIMALEISTGM